VIFAIEMRNSLTPTHVEAENITEVLQEFNLAAATGKNFAICDSPDGPVMINIPNINTVKKVSEDALFTG
jgi:hypothetical protein